MLGLQLFILKIACNQFNRLSLFWFTVPLVWQLLFFSGFVCCYWMARALQSWLFSPSVGLHNNVVVVLLLLCCVLVYCGVIIWLFVDVGSGVCQLLLSLIDCLRLTYLHLHGFSFILAFYLGVGGGLGFKVYWHVLQTWVYAL